MQQVSDRVKKFFADYERSMTSSHPEVFETQYGEAFMFAGPQGAQAIKKDDFLTTLPKRAGFFKAVGLTSSKLKALEETQLDNHYVMVKAYWEMRYEQVAGQPIINEISATYLLYQQADELRIVFQLDHQDLLKRLKELGLLPEQS